MVANMAAGAGFLILCVADHKPRGTPLPPPIAALAAVLFGSIAAHALYTGAIHVREFELSRKKNPFGFWCVVAGLFLCSVRCAFVAV
jgi:hypothetical protein